MRDRNEVRAGNHHAGHLYRENAWNRGSINHAVLFIRAARRTIAARRFTHQAEKSANAPVITPAPATTNERLRSHFLRVSKVIAHRAIAT
ncbi:hypothetical protein B0G80_7895 [Paraburkholderia sp. BL6669N2]|nr:hypothetical protein B0G80_7895 [Paraburkholderia sp. BL6669N2]